MLFDLSVSSRLCVQGLIWVDAPQGDSLELIPSLTRIHSDRDVVKKASERRSEAEEDFGHELFSDTEEEEEEYATTV